MKRLAAALALGACLQSVPSFALQFGTLHLDSTPGQNFAASVPVLPAPGEQYQYAVFRVTAFEVQNGSAFQSNPRGVSLELFGGDRPHLGMRGPVVAEGSVVRVTVEGALQGAIAAQSYVVRMPRPSSPVTSVTPVTPVAPLAPMAPSPAAPIAPLAPRPAAPAAATRQDYYPPPSQPPRPFVAGMPSLNDRPAIALIGYGGGGIYHVEANNDSADRDTTDFGFALAHVAARHLLLTADFDLNRVSLDGGEINFSRWSFGLGYTGPMYRQASWYVKAFGTREKMELHSDQFCGGSCGSASKTGGGVGAGFIFPFAQRWSGLIDIGYGYLGAKDGDPALGRIAFDGRIQVKLNRYVGLWAGGHTSYYFSLENSSDDFSITVIDGRAGLALEFY